MVEMYPGFVRARRGRHESPIPESFVLSVASDLCIAVYGLSIRAVVVSFYGWFNICVVVATMVFLYEREARKDDQYGGRV